MDINKTNINYDIQYQENSKNQDDIVNQSKPTLGYKQKKITGVEEVSRKTPDSKTTNNLVKNVDSHVTTPASTSSFINTKNTLFDPINAKLNVLLENNEFNTGVFLSGIHNEKELQQLKAVSEVIVSLATEENTSIKTLLTNYKIYALQAPNQQYDFLIRTAMLLASKQTGENLESWQVYTKTDKYNSNDPEFWYWVEKLENWTYESQGAAAKFVEISFIKALELAKTTKNPLVIAYKGGFGAGKTSHGNREFGLHTTGTREEANFNGSISPDKGKKLLRRSLSDVSHATAHIQGSNIAFNIFNGLISLSSVVLPDEENKPQKQAMGAVVYDSSLSHPSDISNLIEKSAHANKAFKVVEITRYDVARSLAVLARTVDGEDPRTPLWAILRGAETDRKYRASCMNAVMESQPIQKPQTDGEEFIYHEYDFNSANAQGADTKLICKLQSQKLPKWFVNEKEATARLADSGIAYNADTNKFEVIQTDLKLYKQKNHGMNYYNMSYLLR